MTATDVGLILVGVCVLGALIIWAALTLKERHG